MLKFFGSQKNWWKMRNERDMKLLKWVQSYVVVYAVYAYGAGKKWRNKEIDAKQKSCWPMPDLTW